jgi:hypothetical protein
MHMPCVLSVDCSVYTELRVAGASMEVRMTKLSRLARLVRKIGSPSDQAVADQYAVFLNASGYKILPGNYIGMTNMMPEKQITIGKAPDHYEITIAPSVF